VVERATDKRKVGGIPEKESKFLLELDGLLRVPGQVLGKEKRILSLKQKKKEKEYCLFKNKKTKLFDRFCQKNQIGPPA